MKYLIAALLLAFAAISPISADAKPTDTIKVELMSWFQAGFCNAMFTGPEGQVDVRYASSGDVEVLLNNGGSVASVGELISSSETGTLSGFSRTIKKGEDITFRFRDYLQAELNGRTFLILCKGGRYLIAARNPVSATVQAYESSASDFKPSADAIRANADILTGVLFAMGDLRTFSLPTGTSEWIVVISDFAEYSQNGDGMTNMTTASFMW